MSVRVILVGTVFLALLALGGGVALANTTGPVAGWAGSMLANGWGAGPPHGAMHGGDVDHDAMHESMHGGDVDHDAMHESMPQAWAQECDAPHATRP